MDRENVVHPGVDRTEGKTITFENFKKFIDTTGMSEQQSQRFIDFLRQLFSETSQLWRPGACHACEVFEEKAKRLIRDSSFNDLQIEPRNYSSGTHFWLVGKLAGLKKELIIDPFGVPFPGTDIYTQPEKIIPFFGIIDHAPENARNIYRQGDKDAGYHIFRP